MTLIGFARINKSKISETIDRQTVYTKTGDLSEPEPSDSDPWQASNDLKADFHVANPIRSGLSAILPSKSRYFHGYSEPDPSPHGSQQ